MTDISKDEIRLLPEFDKERFLKMSDEELREFERGTSAACCPNVVVVEEVVWMHDQGGHHREPSLVACRIRTDARVDGQDDTALASA